MKDAVDNFQCGCCCFALLSRGVEWCWMGFPPGHCMCLPCINLPVVPVHVFSMCYTGADGANAPSSAAVAHGCAGVSNVRKQMKLTAFFK